MLAVSGKEIVVRTITRVCVLLSGLLAASGTVLAQAKVNKDIADKVEATGGGPYVLPVLAVILAAVLLALSMLRRSRRS